MMKSGLEKMERIKVEKDDKNKVSNIEIKTSNDIDKEKEIAMSKLETEKIEGKKTEKAVEIGAKMNENEEKVKSSNDFDVAIPVIATPKAKDLADIEKIIDKGDPMAVTALEKDEKIKIEAKSAESKIELNSIVYDNVKTPDLRLDGKTLFVLERKSYEIHTKISEGSFSDLYKGFNKIRKIFVAIKVTDLMKIEKEYRQMFIPKEAQQLSEVRHKNIVAILDIIKAAGKVFVFTEWANGGTLFKLVQENGPVSEPQACQYFYQICSAIEHIHNRLHMAHRTLKLNNIFLHNGYCKVADFGFAKTCWDYMMDRIALANTIVGSEPYLSPQLIERMPYNPFASDIWACGVVLFAILNNRYPFHPGQQDVMLRQQKTPNFILTRYVKKFSSNLIILFSQIFTYEESDRITVSDIIRSNWITKGTKSQNQ